MSAQAKIQPVDATALAVQVDALDGDVREIKDSILGLDAKIEKAVSDLAREVRHAISTLTTQFTERQRTPWAVIFSGAAVTISVLGFVGAQALSPVQADVKALKEQIVPREEINYRALIAKERFDWVTAQINQLQARRYDNLIKSIERLSAENNQLRGQVLSDRDARIGGAVRRLERLETTNPRARILGDQDSPR